MNTGKNWQRGVATGQFNFPPDELAYIDAHPMLLDHQPVRGASMGASYRQGSFDLSFDGIYSSGLSSGFADTQTLPQVLQFDAAAERTWPMPGFAPMILRLSVLNLMDRVNEIRSASGIGIFQAAYGSRRTLYGELRFRF